MNLQLVPTADGSNTLLHTGLMQSYHSLNGALQEARHVFLENGLIYWLREQGGTPRILEVGLGSGLNFLVSAAYCLEHGSRLHYTGIEPFPPHISLLKKSGYADFFPAKGFWEAYLQWYASVEAEKELPEFAWEGIRLSLLRAKLLDSPPLPPADIVYYDAFAPAIQPEMWDDAAIGRAVSSLESGGVFVSYSITGRLKRILKGLGFRVEKPKGAAGKREMTRAIAAAPQPGEAAS